MDDIKRMISLGIGMTTFNVNMTPNGVTLKMAINVDVAHIASGFVSIRGASWMYVQRMERNVLRVNERITRKTYEIWR